MIEKMLFDASAGGFLIVMDQAEMHLPRFFVPTLDFLMELCYTKKKKSATKEDGHE